jgi:membrane protease YdiL (CAAX protease family)
VSSFAAAVIRRRPRGATRSAAVSALLLAGLAAALTIRVAVTGTTWPSSARATLLFSALLLGLAASSGWRPGRLHGRALGWGVVGAAVLCAPPAFLRLLSAPSLEPPPAVPLLGWVPTVLVVAAAEEILLRGALFDAVNAMFGDAAAVAIAAAAFAALHVPLYGWGAIPLDLAAGVWLGSLRVASGGVAAPATAHALADLAWWWLR